MNGINYLKLVEEQLAKARGDHPRFCAELLKWRHLACYEGRRLKAREINDISDAPFGEDALEEKVAEALAAYARGGYADAREEFAQVAAVAIRCMEQCDQEILAGMIPRTMVMDAAAKNAPGKYTLEGTGAVHGKEKEAMASANETVTEACEKLKQKANGENVSCEGLVLEISQEEVWDSCDHIEAAHKREIEELQKKVDLLEKDVKAKEMRIEGLITNIRHLTAHVGKLDGEKLELQKQLREARTHEKGRRSAFPDSQAWNDDMYQAGYDAGYADSSWDGSSPLCLDQVCYDCETEYARGYDDGVLAGAAKKAGKESEE